MAVLLQTITLYNFWISTLLKTCMYYRKFRQNFDSCTTWNVKVFDNLYQLWIRHILKRAVRNSTTLRYQIEPIVFTPFQCRWLLLNAFCFLHFTHCFYITYVFFFIISFRRCFIRDCVRILLNTITEQVNRTNWSRTHDRMYYMYV